MEWDEKGTGCFRLTGVPSGELTSRPGPVPAVGRGPWFVLRCPLWLKVCVWIPQEGKVRLCDGRQGLRGALIVMVLAVGPEGCVFLLTL